MQVLHSNSHLKHSRASDGNCPYYLYLASPAQPCRAGPPSAMPGRNWASGFPQVHPCLAQTGSEVFPLPRAADYCYVALRRALDCSGCIRLYLAETAVQAIELPGLQCVPDAAHLARYSRSEVRFDQTLRHTFSRGWGVNDKSACRLVASILGG